MNSDNLNKENELETVPFDSQTKTADGRKRPIKQPAGQKETVWSIEQPNDQIETTCSIEKERQPRGVWTEDRILACLTAYHDFRPYGVPHGLRTEQWEKMTEAVNKTDPDSVDLCKQAIIDKLHKIMDQYKGRFSELESIKTSRGNFISEMDFQAYTTWKLIQEDENASKETKSRIKEDLDTEGQQKKRLHEVEAESTLYQQNKRQKGKEHDNKEDGSDDKKVDDGPAEPIIFDSDLKIIEESVARSKRQNEEVLKALNTIADAIKEIHQDIKNFNQTLNKSYKN